MKLLSLEILYLRWASQGKSLSEIAALEGRYATDIQFYLEQATRTLGAKSVAEAIEKAKDIETL